MKKERKFKDARFTIGKQPLNNLWVVTVLVNGNNCLGSGYSIKEAFRRLRYDILILKLEYIYIGGDGKKMRQIYKDVK